MTGRKFTERIKELSLFYLHAIFCFRAYFCYKDRFIFEEIKISTFTVVLFLFLFLRRLKRQRLLIPILRPLFPDPSVADVVSCRPCCQQ